MKIRIKTEALADPKDDTLLWPGALYGLQRLSESGHQLSTDTEPLSEDQQRLLDHDGISFNDFSREEANFIVENEDNKLSLYDSDGEQFLQADDWHTLTRKFLFPQRTARVERKTAETDISVSLNLDGTGEADISTGLEFFDHMLEQIARHGVVDLHINCAGDLEVDEHHTIEDVALALGEAIRKALGDKKGIQRYSFVLPMDESRATVALDFSGRPYLKFEGSFEREFVGDVPTEMIRHFFHSLTTEMRATLHIQFSGENEHHKIEACFKGFALTLRAAGTRSDRMLNIIPSSKGTL